VVTEFAIWETGDDLATVTAEEFDGGGGRWRGFEMELGGVK